MFKTHSVPRNVGGALTAALAIVLGTVGGTALAKPPGGMFGPDRAEARLEQMAEQLDLTEAQQEQIRDIVQAQAETRQRDRAAVREQIDAVLTEEQKALRDEQREARMEKRLDRMTKRLDLTDEQRAQVQTIMEEKQAAPGLTREDMRERIAAVLTEEQLDTLAQMRERRGGGPRPGGRAW
jgi:protein CpxP